MTPEVIAALDALGNLALVVLVLIGIPMFYYTMKHSIVLGEQKEKLKEHNDRIGKHDSDIRDLKNRTSVDLVSFLEEFLGMFDVKPKERK